MSELWREHLRHLCLAALGNLFFFTAAWGLALLAAFF